MVCRVADDPDQIGLRTARVRPVAVGRFEQQHIGPGHGLRIGENGAVVSPQVAGVHQPDTIELQLHRRRAQNVTGGTHERGHAGGDAELAVVAAPLHQPQRSLRVLHCVQR